MKKVSTLVIASLLMTAISGFAAPSANAGILLAVIPSKDCDHYGCIPTRANLSGAALIFIGIVSGVTGLLTGSTNAAIVGGSLLVLNADGSTPQDTLAEKLSKTYPFIDNTDVTQSLAASINEKLKSESKPGDSNVFVSLTPDETRTVLKFADLTEEQIMTIVSDLK